LIDGQRLGSQQTVDHRLKTTTEVIESLDRLLVLAVISHL
jgi:hypothetical protein